jgi:putative transposase
MSYHRRQLPHYHPPESILFLTWRLFGSLPANAAFHSKPSHPNPGRSFVQADRFLDTGSHGPVWLKDARIANLLAETLKRGHREYRYYDLLAWVVMPNHVHMVLQPFGNLSAITRWIKGSTARSANLTLGRTGQPFWQYESYDHCIRSTMELNRVIRYVESNPLKAGLVTSIEAWPWSSAAQREKFHQPPHTLVK